MAVMNQMKIIRAYVFIKSKNGKEKANKKTCVFILFFVLLCAIVQKKVHLCTNFAIYLKQFIFSA